MGDSDSFCFSDGEYIGGTTSTHLQIMNLKTFVAPVAALTLAIGSATLSAPEAKAQRYYGGYQGTTTYTTRPRANGFQVRSSNGNSTTFTNRGGGGYRYNNSNGSYGNILFRNY